MAAQRSHSETLVANTPIFVSFPQYFSTITVINHHATGTVWSRTDGQTAAVFADDNYPILSRDGQSFPNGNLSQEPLTRVISGTVISIVSDTACPITVYGT